MALGKESVIDCIQPASTKAAVADWFSLYQCVSAIDDPDGTFTRILTRAQHEVESGRLGLASDSNEAEVTLPDGFADTCPASVREVLVPIAKKGRGKTPLLKAVVAAFAPAWPDGGGEGVAVPASKKAKPRRDR